MPKVTVDLLDKDAICHELGTSINGKNYSLEILNSITSTNDYAKDNYVANFAKVIPICLAEQQTHGRGRHGKVWVSPLGVNIYLSCVWSLSGAKLPALGLVVGLAIVKTLHLLGLTSGVAIKWPNDILWQHKKLAGILIESYCKQESSLAVIGIGLNINMVTVKEAGVIDQGWTSLIDILNGKQDRNIIAARLIGELFSHVASFERRGFMPFMADWQCYDELYGHDIAINYAKRIVTGKMCGVNADGQLLLLKENGAIEKFSSGSIVKNI